MGVASNSEMAGVIVAAGNDSPNRIRVRQLSDKLCQLQDELDNVKQARGEAVELKLKVLDDKLIRAQVSEEEKMKPLHDNVATLTEGLYAERLAREVMDERKTKEIFLKLLEETCDRVQAGSNP